MVEWNSNLWGEIKHPKIYNLPGFNKTKLPKKMSVEYLKLLKQAVDDEDNFGQQVQKLNPIPEKSNYITGQNAGEDEKNKESPRKNEKTKGIPTNGKKKLLELQN